MNNYINKKKTTTRERTEKELLLPLGISYPIWENTDQSCKFVCQPTLETAGESCHFSFLPSLTQFVKFNLLWVLRLKRDRETPLSRQNCSHVAPHSTIVMTFFLKKCKVLTSPPSAVTHICVEMTKQPTCINYLFDKVCNLSLP